MKKHILLVEPDYYTRFPPLSLLKISTYHKSLGDTVKYVRGKVRVRKKPHLIYVTSLFTYSWKPVHSVVKYYKELFPKAKIILGGIYATLMPEHAKLSGADKIYKGLFTKAELMPDYSLVPDWDSSIIFASRGCIRNCKFCAVPKLEGKPSRLKKSIRKYIYKKHKKVVFWDNNILACKNWRVIFDELIDLEIKADFNQGLDARLITDEAAEKISKIKFDIIRLAYDHIAYRPLVKKAIDKLHKKGVNKRKIVVYTLFNYEDTPHDFFKRVKDLLSWGVCSYPMRYQPLNSLEKNSYISPHWTKEKIDMVQAARRVLGVAGVFPPYKALVQKFRNTNCFGEAFALCPPKQKDKKTKVSKNHLQICRPRWGGKLNWRAEIVQTK